MKKTFKSILSLSSKLCLMMAISLTLGLTACGDDEPGVGSDQPGGGNGGGITALTPQDLVGEWMLVKNVVLYSEINPNKEDQVIDYAGGHAPYYRYYKIQLLEDDVLRCTETERGEYSGATIDLKLEGNILYTLDGDKAGEIMKFDLGKGDNNPDWEDVIIRWEIGYSPIYFSAPALSTYMNVTW